MLSRSSQKSLTASGEGEMFLYEDTVGKGILVVIIHDPYTALQDNGAAVQALVNEMHGTSGHFYPVKERLPLGVETGETGEERRVDIDHHPGILPHDSRPQNAHIAGECYKVRPGFPECIKKCPLVELTGGEPGIIDHNNRDAW